MSLSKEEKLRIFDEWMAWLNMRSVQEELTFPLEWLNAKEQIRYLIESQPEVDEEWIEDKLGNLYVSFGLETREDVLAKFKKYLIEAGVKIKEKK